MRIVHRVALGFFALSCVGGTCSEPPYRDVSGTWVLDGQGTATLAPGGEKVDLHVAMAIRAPVPKKRGPVPMTGTVCIHDPKGALTGKYLIDPAASEYYGSDYGGARVDLVAKAADGRTVKIAQAFMENRSPNKLGGSLITVSSPAKRASIKFVDFSRGNVSCP
ncbi:MAG: hypothetical protein ACOC1F_12515 [Myxococcota bacterium]